MVDSTRLRAALMIACTKLAGDPKDGLALAEHFYHQAPISLQELTGAGLANLPSGPDQVLPFPNK